MLCYVNAFSSIDIAFMPIAPCEPRAWMNHAHLDAQQAGQALLDLKAQYFVPILWNTFRFGLAFFDFPIKNLLIWWHHTNTLVTDKDLHILKVGKRHIIPLFS
jgi:L-ascorbate metabolism protein UlaG (beta-lactamase superfamily)